MRNDQWSAIATPAVLAGVAALLIVASPTAAGILALIAAVSLFAVRPMIGWVLVVLAYPFIYLQLFVGESINIPYVDLFAMLTALGVGVRLIVEWWRHGTRPSIGKIPGWFPFLLFIIVAALSLLHVEDLANGVKFLLRPLTFFFLMFVVLPVVVLDTPKRLFTTFRILFLVGGLAAAMGVWSLLFPPEPGAFRRAVPIIVHGMTPLGTNHNLIAEVLVSIIPVGMVLAALSRGTVRRWYVVGTLLYAAVTFLTFSRNGWLTLAVEGMVLLVAFAHDHGVSWKRIGSAAAAAAAVVALAIGVFSTTALARSSNYNRIRLTEIAIAQFRTHPFVGAGIGTFQEAVSRDRWYLADFGEPQEAHGLVQKLLAETGAFGLLTFVLLLAAIVRYVVRMYQRSAIAPMWRFILLALLCSAFGSIVFQLFNTSYFVSKLWLPLGIAVAVARLAERGIALRTSEV